MSSSSSSSSRRRLPLILHFRLHHSSLFDSEFKLVPPTNPRRSSINPTTISHHPPSTSTSETQETKLCFLIDVERRLRYKVGNYAGGYEWLSGEKLQERTRAYEGDAALFRHRPTLLGAITHMFTSAGLQRDLHEVPAQRLASLATHVIKSSSEPPRSPTSTTIYIRARFVTRDVYVVDPGDYMMAHVERLERERELEMEDALLQSSASAGDGMIPASPDAIRGLEVITYDGASSSSTATASCAICLEDFRRGCAVTRMPCSHCFHHKCINTWLGKSHICPVCRFALPTIRHT